MVTGEADILKITENCQNIPKIVITEKNNRKLSKYRREADILKTTAKYCLRINQKTAFFSKISNANIPFWGLSKILLVNLYYNVLFVHLAKSGSRVMAKTALKSR